MRQTVHSYNVSGGALLACNLLGKELVGSFIVNDRAPWYSTTTQQDIDGIPQFPRICLISFDLVASELCTVCSLYFLAIFGEPHVNFD